MEGPSPGRDQKKGEMPPADEAVQNAATENKLVLAGESEAHAAMRRQRSQRAEAAKKSAPTGVVSIVDVLVSESDFKEEYVFAGQGPLGMALGDVGDDAVIVYAVSSGAQAHAQGLPIGVFLTEINGQSIRGMNADTASAAVLNAGRPMTVRFAPGYESVEAEVNEMTRDFTFEHEGPLGIVMNNIGKLVVIYLVDEDSSAKQMGLGAGSVIHAVNGMNVNGWDVTDVRVKVANEARPLTLTVSPPPAYLRV